jgi:hypothetical protein
VRGDYRNRRQRVRAIRAGRAKRLYRPRTSSAPSTYCGRRVDR